MAWPIEGPGRVLCHHVMKGLQRLDLLGSFSVLHSMSDFVFLFVKPNYLYIYHYGLLQHVMVRQPVIIELCPLCYLCCMKTLLLARKPGLETTEETVCAIMLWKGCSAVILVAAFMSCSPAHYEESLH